MNLVCAKNNWSIYAIRNPIDGSLFYVGKTSKHTDIRLNEHYKSHNLKVRKKIELIIKKGLTPEIVCLCKCSFNQSYNKEQYWISKLLNDGHILYNKVLINSKRG